MPPLRELCIHPVEDPAEVLWIPFEDRGLADAVEVVPLFVRPFSLPNQHDSDTAAVTFSNSKCPITLPPSHYKKLAAGILPWLSFRL